MAVHRVRAIVEGHSALMYIGLGFIPDRVRLHNLTDIEGLTWQKEFSTDLTLDSSEGLSHTDGGDDVSVALGAGIAIYRGGDRITTSSEVYKMADPSPNKQTTTTYGTVNRWTLDNVGNKAGHFNVATDALLRVSGARVVIDGLERWIISTTDGIGASDTVLNIATPSGVVTAMYGRFTHIAAPVGYSMPPGIALYPDAEFAPDGQVLVIVAEHDDG